MLDTVPSRGTKLFVGAKGTKPERMGGKERGETKQRNLVKVSVLLCCDISFKSGFQGPER